MGSYAEDVTSISKSEFWATYLANSETCHFPRLTDGEHTTIQQHKLAVDLNGVGHFGSVLQGFCEKNACTAPTVFKSAWALVLGQYVSMETVTFTATVSHLGSPKTSLCRLTLQPEKSVAQLLEDIEAEYVHTAPFQTEKVCDIFGEAKAETVAPVNTHILFDKNGGDVGTFGQFSQSTEGDVVIHIKNSAGGIEADLMYNSSRLSNNQARNISSLFGHVLAEILRDSTTLLGEIETMSQQDIDQIWRWNSSAPNAIEDCVHTFINRKAKQIPNAQAIDASDAKITYGELQDLSNRLAHHLVNLGVGPEVVVPLCFEKSAWAVVAMVGVIKAGGALLFLDPLHPVARSNTVMATANAKIILTSKKFSKLVASFDEKLVAVTVEKDTICALPSQDDMPICDIQPSNMLYVIFTSGSTGNPKGCVIEHRSFLTGAMQQADKSTMHSSSRVLQLAAYTFDVSILETLTALAVGACICIPGDEDRAKGPTQIINDFQANWCFLTPSLAKMIKPEDVPGLKVLVLGGEALSKDDIVTWATHLRLFNGYGPSECSIAATANGPLDVNSDPANIGRALGGVCWIVDSNRHDRLVPIGVVGELLIQGPILAREYLSEPKKTRDAFIKDPKWLIKGDNDAPRRLYKTGDLVRYNSDGTIHFIGRADTQVKLRGLRIELGEIEHHIAREEKIKHSTVILPRNGLCKDRIVALFSLRDIIPETTAEQLELVHPAHKLDAEEAKSMARRNVSQKVPSYMIPSMWIVLKELPLTSSGKIDKVKVSNWLNQMPEDIYTQVIGVEDSGDSLQAKSDMEQYLQDACSQVLHMPNHLMHLNKAFQSLGGDSILAMKLMAYLRADGLKVSIKDILLSENLSDLALCISKEEYSNDLESSENITFSTSMIRDESLDTLGLSTRDMIEDVYPCSSMQQGILLSQHKEAGTYEFQIICEVIPLRTENIDTERLKTAWQKVVQHHPILRTIFVNDLLDGEHYGQLVLRYFTANIQHVHCGDENEVEATVNRNLSINYNEPRPSHQMTICQTSTGKIFCAISISHALIDGNSIMILFRDLRQAYEAKFENRTTPLYRNYISYILGVPEDPDVVYWKNYLEGINPQPFPVLNDGVSIPNELHEIDIEFDAFSKLHEFCLNYNLSPSNVFQVAWGMVLRAYTQSQDVCFGYMTSGRDVSVLDIHDMVGAFVNTLVCRMILDEKISNLELVRRSQKDFLNSLSHQHLSLAKIHHSLPLFGQSLFNTSMTVASDQTAEIVEKDSTAKITFEPFKEFDPTEYDITVNVTTTKKSAKANLRYWTKTISDGQAANIAATFRTALDNILERPQSPLANISTLSHRDHSQILRWNSTELKPVERLVHDMFRDHVMANPTGNAICAWDVEFTYEELDQLSTTLAHHLSKNLGVGPNIFVPTCFDKSGWTVVAMLAVIKAGGANVAVDPKHPQERRNQILSDTEARVVLVGPQHAHLFSGIKNIVMIQRSLFNELPAANASDLQHIIVTPSNPVLMVYTSGSTGKAKGIVIEHRSFCSSVSAWGPILQLGPKSRVFQFCAHSFDTSNADLFGTMMTGGCLCIPSEQERMSDLAGAINRLGANTSWLTPSVACVLKPIDIPGMKVLCLCGEQIKQQNIDDWADKVMLINGYGPAECSINSTYLRYNSKTALGNIGTGLGTLTWVVDPENHDRLCSIGAIGELLIEGPLVARGYIHNKEKTDSVFIENPEWAWKANQAISRRFYKTGDLVRYNSDGTINYLGRADSQVKINGQRTELGEIEHHLSMAPGIERGVILFPKSGPCAGRLVGIASLTNFSSPAKSEVRLLSKAHKQEASLQVAEIRKYLEEKVPTFMVPTIWVLVTKIPLTTSAKVDRLMMSKLVNSMSEDVYQELIENDETSNTPRTEMEKQLQMVWSRVLNLPTAEIGMDAPFLSLGGDSITAMQLTAACRAEGIIISVKDILQCKTIAKIALGAKYRNGAMVSVGTEIADTPFKLSPIQKLYFDNQAVPRKVGESTHFNQSWLLRVKKQITIQHLSQILAAIVAHHSMLRSRFRFEGSRWVQVISNDVDGSFSVQKHYTTTREEMLSIIHLSQSALNYEDGPVFGAHLFESPNDEQFLFLVAHHLVIDLVSWRIILQDLEDLLNGHQLPTELPLSFQVWCQIQEQDTISRVAEKHYLSRNPTATYDFWGMGSQSNLFADAEERIISIDETVAAAVFGNCQGIPQTEPADLILTALIYAFQKTFKERPQLEMFIEGHGREVWDSEIDLSRTVGWFTTMSPLFLQADKEMNLTQLLRSVKESHQKLPDNGRPYFAAQMMNSENELTHFHQTEAIFNYLGRYQQLEREDALLQLEPMREGESTQNSGANVPRSGLFEIYAVMIKDKLQVSFTYNKKMKHQQKIQDWISSCQPILSELVEHLKLIKFHYTLSDFPLLPLTEPGLNRLEERFRELQLDAQNIDDAYPCSPMQEGILISQAQMSEAYRIEMTCEVLAKDGAKIDADRLQASWQRVVDRHPMLRTIFVESACESSLYDQIVLKKCKVNIDRLQSEDPLQAFQDQTPMKYEEAAVPIHRLSICESVSESRVFMKLEVNHTLIDGQSMPIILRDLTLAYQENVELGAGPQYRDYISYLQSQSKGAGIDYWQNRLSTVELCYFPMRRHHNKSSESSRLESINIEIENASELNAFCVENNVTMANVFQTAWALVLRAYTGLDNVNFGYLSSGRDVDVDGISDAVGPFINMLVCQLHVDNSLTALQAVEKMQEDFLTSLPHQHCSLAEIQHALNTQGQALFNTMLSLQRPISGDSAEQPEISFRDTGSEDPTEYDVSVNISASNKNIEIYLTYWTGKMSKVDAENTASTFTAAVKSILISPKSRLHDLNLFSSRNREQVWSWNNNGVAPNGVDSCIHHKIKEMALEQPDAPALCAWDGNMTYLELDQATDRLAQYLVSLGVAPEVSVPTCFDKSMWTIVAMIAIWKAGGACVALDPSHPIERLKDIISATSARVVLGGRSYETMMRTLVDKAVVLGDSTIGQLPELTTNFLDRSTPYHPAFVCFTSGSTGKPKGIEVLHRGFCTLAEHWGPETGFDKNTRAFQFCSYTFDTSNAEMYITLIRGGCVCVPSDHDRLHDLAGAMRRLQVNWAFLTPTIATLLHPHEVPNVKTLVLGGEAARPDNVLQWSEHVRLINSYGPAETTVWSSRSFLTPGSVAANIGRGDGGLMWIADPGNHNLLTPVGCVGELLTQGALVARGYLNDEEKTKAAFIQNPAWLQKDIAESGEVRRLYKTGDLVKYNDDGSLLFVGRVNESQVKLHGQRIELGEIEHQISLHPLIKHAVVFLPKTGIVSQRIVAVVSLQQFASAVNDKTGIFPLPDDETKHKALLQLADVRVQVSDQLPSYMVPSTWLVVKDLPSTTSKKIDRGGIRKWVYSIDEETYQRSADLGDDILPEGPPNETEEKLRAIIARVLNIPINKVARSKSFLNLGGDSISAMQVISACRSTTISLTIKDILRSKTISEMASHAVDANRSFLDVTEEYETPFSLSPMQQMYFDEISRDAPTSPGTHYNQSFLLRLTQNLRHSDVAKAIEVVAQRHSMLRARFTRNRSGVWCQQISQDVANSYRYQTIEARNTDEIASIIASSQSSLNIENGPVFAAELIDVCGENQLLFLVAHHLVVDLVSWRVIIKDIEDILTMGTLSSAHKPLPFQSWSRLQSEYAAQNLSPDKALPYEVPKANYEYWGMNKQSNLQGDIVELGFTLDKDSSSKLLFDCHEAFGTEPLDVFLSAIFHSFSGTFGRSSPTIFNEGHGRESWNRDIDISETVGWFTTMFPIHITPKNYDVIESIKLTKDNRRRLPDNGWPYFASRYLNEQGIKSFSDHWPIEIVFNYLGAYQQLEKADGLLQLVAKDNLDVGRNVNRLALFDIYAVVIDEAIRFSFTFNRHMERQDQIRSWVKCCEQSLIEHAEKLSESGPEITSSDFRLINMDYNDLEKFKKQTLTRMKIRNLDEVEDIYPCSPVQEGILISQGKTSGTYAVQDIFEVHSYQAIPDVDQIKRSWQRVVDRHSSLRTVFVENICKDTSFGQVVLKKHTANILDITASNGDILEALDMLPPMEYSEMRPHHRLSISQVEGRIMCKLEISHALIDGTSMPILIRDFSLACENKLALNGPLYRDYIAYIQSKPMQESIDYWTNYLSETKPCHFPNLNDGIVSLSTERYFIDVEMPSASELHSFCQANGLTLANLLRTAWAVLLSAYTGTNNVCFGYLVSGRDVPVEGVDNAIGAFINMLVCTANVEDMRKSSVISATEKMQDEYFQSLHHQHSSLAVVQNALKLSEEALFNTVLTFQKKEVSAEVGQSAVSFVGIKGDDPSEYDISVKVQDGPDEVKVMLKYLRSHVSTGQATNLASAFGTLVKGMLAKPQSKIADISMFSTLNQGHVKNWNAICPPKIDHCVHTMFQKQAIMQPHAEAIDSWDASFTYRSLDEITTKIAHHLCSLGVKPEILVPVCMERSAWSIVSMLAIMKAGGGFVPLDASHPIHRLESILDDCNSSIVLVSPQTAEKFLGSSRRTVIISESTVSALPQQLGNFDSSVRPNNVVYTLFTSGSTGKPKGVVLEHAAVTTSLIHHGREFGFTSSARVFQFSAYTFDAMVMEIFTTLVYGGCICVPSESERMGDIANAMTRMKVNLSYLTASVVRLIKPQNVPTLRILITGGEAVGQDIVELWADKLCFIGSYGPTECCFTCTLGTYVTPESASSSIGVAVGSHAWIVEPENHNKLAPVGAVGELLMSGPILAREYLKNKEKTELGFIEDPEWLVGDFKALTNEFSAPSYITRLYKTGDLVRYNSDGTIMFLGRKDQQVKLRGLRIELGEIEYHLKSKLSGSKSVAVEIVTPEVTGKRPTLAAFFTLSDDVARVAGSHKATSISETDLPDLLALQTSLANVLPSYMVPSLYIPLNFIPETTSTKIDRAELRKLALNLSEKEFNMYSLSTGSKKSPTTEIEKQLRDLWATILDIQPERIGIEDNFFRLGGDSIMAMRLATTAFDAGVSITIANIFRNPILSGMAAVSERILEEKASIQQIEPFQLLDSSTSAPDIIRQAAVQCQVESDLIQDIYPCTPLQEGMMALSRKQHNAYLNQKVLRLPPTVEIDLLKEAWQLVTDLNPILRTRIIQTDSSEFLQVVVQEEHHWRSGESLHGYLEADKNEPFNYGDPLARFGTVADGESFYFIFTASHSIYDGSSLPLLFEQVQKTYNFETVVEGPPFNNFIKYLQDMDKSASISFWETQLSEGKPATYPHYPSPKHQLHVDQSIIHSVDFQRNQGSDITTSTLLRAAWAITVGQYAESSDVIFGATLSGRNAPIAGIEKISGPTITTVPIRIQLDPEQSIQNFLQSVQKQATDMIAFEQTGLQNIGRISTSIKEAIDFRNLIVIQPAPIIDGQSAFLESELIDLDVVDFDTYPMVVECGLRGTGFDIQTRYDQDVISTWQMKKILHLFEHVVQQLSKMPESQKLGEIDMFSPEDKKQVNEWNTLAPKSVESCVPDIFRSQVKQRPDALAVSAWDGDLTYKELDGLSDRLACYLVSLGVGPEKMIPLCFDKSCWAVIAMLGVMKAGGACVNLGSSHPRARLAGIIRDAEAEIVLVAPQHAHLFDDLSLCCVIIQPSFIANLPAASDTSTVLPTILPTNPAFVLFTSGSTGKSKGIVVEHGSLCTSSEAHGTTWNIGPGTRVFQFANFTFDVSVADVFTTIQRGGCVCLPSEADRVNDLSGAVTKLRANWAFLTPSVALLLEPKNLPTLKTLVLGGEAPTREVIQKWADHLDLICCYGPAEATIYCSGNKPAIRSSDPSNLGHPIGVSFWVTDVNNHDRLVPIGSVGELLLEGRTIARGYLHEPEKTANAFITNPAWLPKTNIDRRLYKTGDLVRYNQDGSVRFVARKDTQLKIRGQRVELGEIEFNIMKTLPGLHHVTVDVSMQKHTQGRQTLVAFLSFNSREDIKDASSELKLPMTEDLRTKMIQLEESLNGALPSYMIPTMYIPLEQIPLTLNGKADRTRLRKLATDMSKEESITYSLASMGKKAPTTRMELKLQRAWAATMNLDPSGIGSSDNFFRLGGDSITAMKLVGLARSQQISLTVGDIFKFPTLSSMANVAEDILSSFTDEQDTYKRFSLMDPSEIDNFTGGNIWSQTNFSQEDVLDILPATDFQSNCVAHSILRSRGLLNYFFLDGEGPADLQALQRSCLQLVQQHEILRTVFILFKTQFLQVVLKNLIPKFERYETEGDIVKFSLDICKQDSAKRYVLGEPFVQFYLVENSSRSRHRLVMRMSHSQYDGVCLPQIWNSLRLGYQRGSQDLLSTSPAFSHYVSEVQKLRTPESYQYWQNLLKGSSMTNIVVHNKPSYSHRYDTRITQMIKSIPLAVSGITFATVIKSAWGLVLAELEATSDVVFGHVISGRNTATTDVEKIVGGCVNIIPVRVTLQEDWKAIDLLQHIQNQQVANIPFETLGFREIIRECTEWPSYTRFSSIVQHQNIDLHSSVSFEDTSYSISSFCPMADESDVAVMSTPRGEEMEILLQYSSVAIAPEFAQHLLIKLCDRIQNLSSDINAPLLLPKLSSSLLPLNPVVTKEDVPLSISSQMTAMSEIRPEVAARLENCWRQALSLSGMANLKISPDISFFDVGGDLVSVTQLAVILEQDGFVVSAEELIDCHIFSSQVALLS